MSGAACTHGSDESIWPPRISLGRAIERLLAHQHGFHLLVSYPASPQRHNRIRSPCVADVNRIATPVTITNRIGLASFLVPIHPHDAVIAAVAGDVAEIGVQLPVVKRCWQRTETWGRLPGRESGLPRNWFSGRTHRCLADFPLKWIATTMSSRASYS